MQDWKASVKPLGCSSFLTSKKLMACHLPFLPYRPFQAYLPFLPYLGNHPFLPFHLGNHPLLPFHQGNPYLEAIQLMEHLVVQEAIQKLMMWKEYQKK
jgi:hypothetical protein